MEYVFCDIPEEYGLRPLPLPSWLRFMLELLIQLLSPPLTTLTQYFWDRAWESVCLTRMHHGIVKAIGPGTPKLRNSVNTAVSVR